MAFCNKNEEKIHDILEFFSKLSFNKKFVDDQYVMSFCRRPFCKVFFWKKYRKIFDLNIDYEFTSFYEKNNLLFPSPPCLF